MLRDCVMTKISPRQDRVKLINTILLILFSIFSALGSFNPFTNVDLEEAANSSSSVALIIQGLFIVSLIPLRNPKSFLKTEYKILIAFAALWCATTIIFAGTDISLSLLMNIVKLILCILLFYKLPALLIRAPRLLIYSIFAFSLTCAVIATLFSAGLLDQYVLWSNGRAYIFYENPNSTSTRMVFSVIFLLYIVLQNPLKWKSKRLILLVLLLPLLYSIMASGSRGSFVVLVICGALYLLLLPSKKPIRKLLIVSIAALVSVGVFLKLSENEEFSMIERLTDSIENNDDAGRGALSAAALDIFLDHPIVGVGAVEFMHLMWTQYGYNRTVHNLYWYVAATSGIIGLILFGTFLISLFARCGHSGKLVL